jgi:putative addiction module killer protein
MNFQIFHYLAPGGRDLFQNWLDGMRDSIARVAVQRRVERMARGIFGDHGFCRDGVWELRVDVGPGYRVYYARSGVAVILLLCGGDKRKQDADIDRAVACWRDYLRRSA